jgi:hypothetical protein
MKIENGSLVVTVQGVEKTVPLPTVAADAKVKAWAVPADYRADGLFVAVTVKGESEEIPACDLADQLARIRVLVARIPHHLHGSSKLLHSSSKQGAGRGYHLHIRLQEVYP